MEMYCWPTKLSGIKYITVFNLFKTKLSMSSVEIISLREFLSPPLR